MNSLKPINIKLSALLSPLVLAFFALSPTAQGVTPAPDESNLAGAPTRPTTSQLLFDHAFFGGSIGPGQAVPFQNSTPFVVGTAIRKTNDTTFTLNVNGVYRVSYTLRTDSSSIWIGLFELQIQVNGAAVGEGAALWLPGAPLVDQVAFQATAGSTVQIVNGGNATYNIGPQGFDTVTINIDEVQ